MKTVLVGLLLAGSMLAETVYFGKASKVYHVTVSCSAKGGAHALQADRKEAEAHGLRACKRCGAPACETDTDCEKQAAAKAKRAGNGAWGKAAVKAAPVKAEVKK